MSAFADAQTALLRQLITEIHRREDAALLGILSRCVSPAPVLTWQERYQIHWMDELNDDEEDW